MGNARSTGSQRSAPDLILADVVMPEKNGYEVCEAIKANPATARIPVVLLSGTFEPFDRDRAERLGCDAIVSKPFDSQQLLRQVEALLARARARSRPRLHDGDSAPDAGAAAAPGLGSGRPGTAPAETGFASEDFTGSIPRAGRDRGGPDLFEEEYGQADVESAIAAFEKAHPEFAYVEDANATAAMTPGDNGSAPSKKAEAQGDTDEDKNEKEVDDAQGREPAGPSSPAGSPRTEIPRWPSPRRRRLRLRRLRRHSGCRGSLRPNPSRSSRRSRSRADDSASRRTQPEPMRADEGPTQQIPLAAEYASLARGGAGASGSADRVTDETDLPHEIGAEEHTAEIPIMRGPLAPDSASSGAGTGTGTVRRPEDATPVPREIEELAQSTSIGQLKEMLSSVSRTESSALTDDEIDRLASRVVERLSEKIVREIAWEVIPDVAELVIKQRIKELESGVE